MQMWISPPVSTIQYLPVISNYYFADQSQIYEYDRRLTSQNVRIGLPTIE
jgi:hypothetical protein